MITHEDIRELAQFQAGDGCALSFYFQPQTPQNKSHREEAILAKDLVREALREAEKGGARNGCARADLHRILELAEHLHGNQARAKAVFACAARQFWREFDLPPRLSGTRLFVNCHFHLKPLAAAFGAMPRVCVLTVGKKQARFFELWLDEIREREQLQAELPRRGRSDGFLGYDAGHAERHVEHEAMHHFKAVADRLKELQESATCEKVIIGCRDETWPEFEPHLHAYAKQRLLGRFAVDSATAGLEQVRENAMRILREAQASRRQALLREVLGEAHRNGRGSLGPRRVLHSLEAGEIQTLLLGEKFAAAAVECCNCAHLDFHTVSECAVCGSPTRHLDDVTEAILARAIGKGIEVVYVEGEPEFEKVGNIAALLRFRADQSTANKLAG